VAVAAVVKKPHFGPVVAKAPQIAAGIAFLIPNCDQAGNMGVAAGFTVKTSNPPKSPFNKGGL
jgi:hypothetical protein